MGARRKHLPFVILLAAPLAVGCASGTRPAAEPPPPSARSLPSDAEVEAIYRARMDSARMRFTEADVAFMTGMIHHHAQAVEMSQLAPTHDASPSIRTLAARIINSQLDEIAIMRDWLRERGQPAPEVHVTEGGAMVHGGGHAMHMPGMLSGEQMAELRAARGPEFDHLFLTYMIQHHRGAVTMVHDLFSKDGAGQDDVVFKFASDVQVDQASEIARMERMLSALPGREQES